jgi:hypothetical protein
MTDTTLSMTARPIPVETMPGSDDADWAHDSWEITLTFQGRSMSLKFHTGTGHRKDGRPTPPDIGDILSSVALDAGSVLNARDFEDWAADFGYDTDSRKAEATYKACQEQTEELSDLLGDWLEIVAFEAPDDGDWSEFKGTSIDLPDATIAKFRRLANALDDSFPDSVNDGPANEHYYQLRDELLAYIDEHPEVREEARAAGLPVD